MIHTICLNGCDDDTVFEMDMTEEQLIFLKKVAIKTNNTSKYGCMPRLYIDGEKLMNDEEITKGGEEYDNR